MNYPKKISHSHIIFLSAILFASCSEDNPTDIVKNYEAIDNKFLGQIDLNNLDNYANQSLPVYITKDNTNQNVITDAGATLGRVLFYDKNLSVDGTISCANCHLQANAFSDNKIQSTGVDGVTGRHSMRLINSRYSDETKFFWNERASSLEDQTTQPIQDHIEMGFSGANGDPGITDLINTLESLDYYQELFQFVYGDSEITEDRLQKSLAQFIRSIQSFDSKFDKGRIQVNNSNNNFPNYTAEENLGKKLFLDPPNANGAGCAGCHRPPEFDIDPNSLNNGVIDVVGNPDAIDLLNTRAPTLRDLFNQNGFLNGQLMHSGAFNSMEEVIDHYDRIIIDPQNTNLDPRLVAGGQGRNLQLTQDEKNAIVAFLKTLSGTAVYSESKWSDPF